MKKNLSLVYKLLIVVISSLGIILNLKIISLLGPLICYTIQSDIMCFIFYLVTTILITINKLQKNNSYYIYKYAITITSILTMFVYQIFFLLYFNISKYQYLVLVCGFIHLFIPLLIIFDYIMSRERCKLKKNYPFILSISIIFYYNVLSLIILNWISLF